MLCITSIVYKWRVCAHFSVSSPHLLHWLTTTPTVQFPIHAWGCAELCSTGYCICLWQGQIVKHPRPGTCIVEVRTRHCQVRNFLCDFHGVCCRHNTKYENTTVCSLRCLWMGPVEGNSPRADNRPVRATDNFIIIITIIMCPLYMGKLATSITLHAEPATFWFRINSLDNSLEYKYVESQALRHDALLFRGIEGRHYPNHINAAINGTDWNLG